MTHWTRTDYTHDGGAILVNRLDGELAYEDLMEGRLMSLPSAVEADVRRRLDSDRLAGD